MKQQIVRVTAIKLQICNFLSILCLSAPLREKNSPPTAVFRFNFGEVSHEASYADSRTQCGLACAPRTSLTPGCPVESRPLLIRTSQSSKSPSLTCRFLTTMPFGNILSAVHACMPVFGTRPIAYLSRRSRNGRRSGTCASRVR